MKKITSFVAFWVMILTLPLTAYAAHPVFPWPANLVRHNDIALASTPYETSGVVLNSQTDKLFAVGDNGKVTMMNSDGSEQDTRNISVNVNVNGATDFEGIAIADSSTNKVYIGIENPDSIAEYDWTPADVQNPNTPGTEVVGLTGKIWNLESVLTSADVNAGLEALTFVPNGYHPFADSDSGGLFYAAIQRPPILNDAEVYNNYLIYAFDIDLSTNGRVVDWHGIPITAGTPDRDVSDMYFSTETGVLYVLYDSANRLIEMEPDGTAIREFTGVPIIEQEAFVIKTDYPLLTADVYIGSDDFPLIGWFSGYSVNYDVDGDGVENSEDCAIYNDELSVNRTYYEDLDGDGLGSDVVLSVCANSAPAGYVENSDDRDDAIFNDPNDMDGDGIARDVDCDDENALLSVNRTYYEDLDGDGLGSDVVLSVCANSAPAGYVENSDDRDDAVFNNVNDMDGDGIARDVDCDDENAFLSVNRSYYEDLDGDGLGSDIVLSVCANSAPAGYVENSDDRNDAIFNDPNDMDGDGVARDVDCNDENVLLSVNRTYYEDLDGDGLGSDIVLSVCANSAPAGYVENSDDRNDIVFNDPNDMDGDGVARDVDCDDENALLSVNRTYYEDLDGDGLGSDVVLSVCANSAPAGYVENSDDRDDAVFNNVNDMDGDGIARDVDCNDNNPAISRKKRFYRDADGDGFGAWNNSRLVCSVRPPLGYVSNLLDPDDSVYDCLKKPSKLLLWINNADKCVPPKKTTIIKILR